MAEAAVVGPPQRFYCHVCKQEFTNVTSEYTCPVCSDGFIEELHDADPSPSTGNNIEVDVLELLNTGFRGAMPAEGSGPGNSDWPTPPLYRRRHRPIHHHHHHHHHPQQQQQPQQRMGPPTHPSSTTAAAADGSVAGPAMANAYDQLIRDFFAYVGVPGANGRRLITTGGASGRADQLTLTPMFFIGNPGDYVWGHDGLDSVITLMLNQLEPTGPPPMSAQKIDEIPKWHIGQDELDKKMQCSVCLEDFQMQEQCRKLACAHIFHESCIVPWLELHGTCPICRDTFTEAQDESQSEEMETDAPTNRFENILSDIQRPRGVDVLGGSNFPRATSSSEHPSIAGTIGSTAVSGGSSSSSHNNSHAMSSQSETSTNNANSEANVPTRNNLNFHLDDGLD